MAIHKKQLAIWSVTRTYDKVANEKSVLHVDEKIKRFRNENS